VWHVVKASDTQASQVELLLVEATRLGPEELGGGSGQQRCLRFVAGEPVGDHQQQLSSAPAAPISIIGQVQNCGEFIGLCHL
jgi:hypothetical protein